MATNTSSQSGNTDVSSTIIALERGALDRWCRGEPRGFLDLYATDVTYFDPSVDKRVDGRDAMTAYLVPITGQVKIDRYEMLHPDVKRHGDVAILTYNVVNYAKQPDGSEKPRDRWNITEIYRQTGGKWQIIHSHFSFTKPELKKTP
jgi:uncharacterized protein (TIGR02246 family)